MNKLQVLASLQDALILPRGTTPSVDIHFDLNYPHYYLIIEEPPHTLLEIELEPEVLKFYTNTGHRKGDLLLADPELITKTQNFIDTVFATSCKKNISTPPS